MKLVLIGYMGSGKSVVGTALAEVLGQAFIDLDAYIEKKEGQSISQLFDNKGVIYFRKREAQLLFELLEDGAPAIIATGGGTPCYGGVMDRLLEQEGVTTIYLKHSVDVLSDRLYHERTHRPLIAHLDDPQELNEFVRKHLFERGFDYGRSQWVIDCDGLDVGEVVRTIVGRLF